MTNEEISFNTKKTLSKALKSRVEHMPFDKIKVSHLIKDCNITRSTFYYHFRDIYELLEWIFEFEAIIPLKELQNIDNFDESLSVFMDYLKKNSILFISAYNSMGRDIMHRSILKHIRQIVEKFSVMISDKAIEKVYFDFIFDFYSRAYISLLLDWLVSGMKISPKEMLDLLDKTMKGCMELSLERASEAHTN